MLVNQCSCKLNFKYWPLNQQPECPHIWFVEWPMTSAFCHQMDWWARENSSTLQRLRGSRRRTMNASPTMEWLPPISARLKLQSTVSTVSFSVLLKSPEQIVHLKMDFKCYTIMIYYWCIWKSSVIIIVHKFLILLQPNPRLACL